MINQSNKLYTVVLLLQSCLLLYAAQVSAEVFNLDDCLREVNERNPTLSISRLDILEKEMALESAKKNRYPTLSFQYDYTRQFDREPLVGMDDYYAYSFSARQPLFQGKALLTAVELSELSLQSSGAGLQKSRNDIAFAVHGRYFNILRAEKLAEVAEQAVAQLKSHTKDAAAFYEAGLIPKNDLLQSEVQLAQAEQDLFRAKNNVLLSKASMNLLMRRDVNAELSIVDIVDHNPKPINWDELLQTAAEKRSELIQADIAVQQAEKNIIIAKAPFLPSVDVSAVYKRQGDTPGATSYPLGDDEIRLALASLKWNFWSWRQEKNEAARARQMERKSRQSKELVMDAVILDVKEAVLNVQLAEESIRVTKKATEQAEENFRISKARYQSQLATSTEVLDAQTLLTRARSNFFAALYDYNLAASKLDWSIGVLAED